MFDQIEHFGEGARAQISSNLGDSTLFGNSSGPSSQVMAANAFAPSGYQSEVSSILSPTTPQQYQQMNTQPRYPTSRPMHQPDFSPHIQQQFLRYERLLAEERRKNRQLSGNHYNDISSDSRYTGIVGQIQDLAEKIFRFILAILNFLIGWLF